MRNNSIQDYCGYEEITIFGNYYNTDISLMFILF